MKHILILLWLCLTAIGSMSAQPLDTLTMRIKGMRCDECAHKVMVKVMEIPGVTDIWFNIERRTASVSYDPAKTSPQAIKSPLVGTRYNPSPYTIHDIILRGWGQRMIELQNEADARRAVAALQGKSGIDSLSAHVGRRYLFIRYDANRTSKAEIRKQLLAAGFTPSNYYTGPKIAYINYKIDATHLSQATEEELIGIDGVEDATVNRQLGTLAITYFSDETTAEKLTDSLRALVPGLKVQ